VLCVAATVLSTFSSSTAEEPIDKPVAKYNVDELLKLLADEDFETRAAASAELGKRPEAFVPLHHALRSTDAETARLARAAIDKLKPIFRKQALKRLKETLDRGEVDLFVDRFVHLRDDVTPDEWKALLDFAERIHSRACDARGLNIRRPACPFLDYKTQHGDVVAQGGIISKRKIAADKVALDSCSFSESLLVCRGPVKGNNWTLENVIFANGNVTTRGKELGASISQCLIVSDGDIESGTAADSVLIASGAIKTQFKPLNCVVIQKDPNPLKLIRRFDLSAVGADVKDAQPGVEVVAVAEKKPFGVAGLRKGDRIVEVEGEQTATPEDLRRQVRGHCLDDQVTRVNVRRGDQMVQLLVHLVY
jgi:hypothetical protein